jgi:hypothetical protein
MRRARLIALLCASALVAAGCGSKEAIVTEAETEGVTVDVAGLSYQVQISRYLNPYDVEDAYYLRGLPAGSKLDPGRDEVWFGIFMRVKNFTDQTRTAASGFTITDTENNKFQPIPLDGKQNPFLYEPLPIPHAGVLPEAESPAANGPIQGSEILFRIKTDSLQNRPLVLHIEGPAASEATVDLDL